MNFHRLSDASESDDRGLTLRARNCGYNTRRDLSRQNLTAHADTSYGRVNWITAFGASRFRWFTGVPFVLYRLILAMFAIGVLVWSGVFEARHDGGRTSGEWLYYLTNWLLMINVLYFLSLLWATLMTQCKHKETSNLWRTQDAPLYARIAWVTNAMSLTGGLFVVVLYWAGAADDDVTGLNILAHGGVFAAVVLDHLLIGMQPFFWVQFYWVTLLGLAYGIWTIIFYYSGLVNYKGDRWIYGVIKWETNTGMAVFFAFVCPIVIIPLFQGVFWIFNYCRKQAIFSSAIASTPALPPTTAHISTGAAPVVRTTVQPQMPYSSADTKYPAEMSKV